MTRLAIVISCLAIFLFAGGVYKLGDKTLFGHLGEIYRSPLVQKKVNALQDGIEARVDTLRGKRESAVEEGKAKKATPAKNTALHKPASPGVIDVRPSVVERKKPAQDALTENDREDLDDLLNKKLSK